MKYIIDAHFDLLTDVAVRRKNILFFVSIFPNIL